MNYFIKIPSIEIDKWAPNFTWSRLLTLWQNGGIEGIIIPISLNDQLDGFVDRIQTLIQIAKQKNLQSWIIVPILLNNIFFHRYPDRHPVHRLEKNFSFTGWFTPVCPSDEEYRIFFEKSASGLFDRLESDVVLLDFLRIPYFWEEWGNLIDENEWPPFCYCKTCKQNFENRIQISFEGAKLQDWQDWQCLLLSDWLERIKKQISAVHPGIRIGAQIIPLQSKNNHEQRSDWIGQNLQYLQNHLHFFSPLVYEKLLNWNHDDTLSFLVDILSKQKLPVVPSVQISRIKWDRKMDDENSQKDLIERMEILGIRDVSVFHGRELLSEKGIRSHLG